ncbi:hypothetical protein, partial [Nocardiopsis exhalans]
MPDLPYTYTDEGGDQIHVHHSYLTVVHSGESGVALLPDADPDRVELARAVLGEGTGHVVISKEDSARAMRDRVASWLDDHLSTWEAEQISALLLLPDDDAPSCPDGPATRSGHRYVCEDDQGHDGLHHALSGSVTWGTPSPIHVATPEGITPCGRGHHDVPVAALIPEATCVECLRAVAVEKGEQVAHLRHELERAVSCLADEQKGTLSARFAQLERDMSRIEARLVDEYTVQAPVAGERLAADNLTRMQDRVSQLERDMGRAERRLNLLEVAQGRVDRLHDRVDALELAQREAAQSGGAPRAQVTGGSVPEPARYRDATGDMWEERPDGLLATIAVHRDRPGDLGVVLPR